MLYEYKNIHSVKLSYVFTLYTSRIKRPQLKLAFIHTRRTACALPAMWYNKQSEAYVNTDFSKLDHKYFPP